VAFSAGDGTAQKLSETRRWSENLKPETETRTSTRVNRLVTKNAFEFPETGNRKPETRNPKPETRNPKPETVDSSTTNNQSF